MPPKQDMSHQTALRLPHDLYKKLAKIGGERGMGAEIRRRLELSFAQEHEVARSPKLTELQQRIGDLAGSLPLDTDGEWYADPFAFHAFRAGVLTLLDNLKPAGEPKPPTGTGRVLGIDDPEALGRAWARLVVQNASR